MRLSRREVLKAMGSASAAAILPIKLYAAGDTWTERTIHLAAVSRHTVRLTIIPIVGGTPAKLLQNGSLLHGLEVGPALEDLRGAQPKIVKLGDQTISVSSNPLRIEVINHEGQIVQRLALSDDGGSVSFLTGDVPVLALGEGGAQFDRRGTKDAMISGQGGYKLETHGGRVPIPWLIGTSGWAIFFHQPLGTFDLTGPESKFHLASPDGVLDLFVVISGDPATIMAEYARLTGHPELPPLWSFGYLQSHRTLGDRESVLAEAKMFREKKLPCDALIYLGTGFCPNGWNVRNGSFDWNERVFPDPKSMIAELHAGHFKFVPHVVIEARTLRGTPRDKFDPAKPNPEEAASYWDAHRPDFRMGIDGWWPDEGDWLNMPARLVRNQMYWEGPQIDRPSERPFALHRNGAPGMQRYASFLWSGDVYSRWETLKTHLPIAINTGLSGIPYWGTDIGGFVPTAEFTAELYLRWFQFGAFCPLFRCHGRNWTLRLPWGWNTGDSGPQEVRNYRGSGLPDPIQLHNAAVEPICRKYLELRSRLMPYLYSAVHEATKTGLPLMRALWLHYPNDPKAVSTSDVYLWGRDLLVAPVVEKAATSRTLYLPQGVWYDFWTGERHLGGRMVTRLVDLETMPLFVRAGVILPMGPIKQYCDEIVGGPLELHVYEGADGKLLHYEDDGKSFNYRRGEWMGIEATWNDARQMLSLRLAKGSKMLDPAGRRIEVHVGGQVYPIVFKGRPVVRTFAFRR